MARFQRLLFIVAIALLSCRTEAQTLRPGFDASEYEDMLKRSASNSFINSHGAIPKPSYDEVYTSQEVGMHNKWRLWENKQKTIIVINIRGTVPAADSWLENLYSAMIPAKGTLKISGSNTFDYKFAAGPKAMVHVGWAIGVGVMAPDILEKIRSYYSQGVKQIIVEGHSQGGVIALLLSAYLHYQVADGQLPGDIVIKTYASAPPKPGNLFFAYDFESYTRDGWAYSIINAADWVPQTPVSVQTVNDYNPVNPFVSVHDILRKQKLLVRLYGGHVYNSMVRAAKKPQRKYDKYLGKAMYKRVRKYMPELQQPKYTASSDYMPAGDPIVFQPDSEYYRRFPDTGSNLFRNHLFEPYYYLVTKAYNH